MAIVNPIIAWRNPAYRLARRISFGVTQEEAAKAVQLGAKGYLEYQLNYTAINDTVCQAAVTKNYPRLTYTGDQLSRVDGWVSRNQLLDATLYRMIYSKRQLYEKMVHFWRDHFNVFMDKCGTEMILPYENKVLRPYAMSSFYNILVATAKSPCMMRYLDNEPSSKASPNQNYARELLELHTLGVSGGYTQTDVVNVAKCFTGWGINYDNTHYQTYLTFNYDDDNHDKSQKTVLGTTIPANGNISDGEAVLKLLAAHPQTAKHVCTKLIRYFMGAEPATDYLNSVASVFLSSGGDIKSVLRAIFSVNMANSPAKLKQPMHLVASAIRALQPSTFGTQSVEELRGYYLEITNNLPYYWAPPNGYPDSLAYWASNMLERWNFGFDLANNAFGSIAYDPATALAGYTTAPLTAAGVATALGKIFCMGEMSAEDLSDLNTKFLAQGTVEGERLAGAFALAMNSPSFQHY